MRLWNAIERLVEGRCVTLGIDQLSRLLVAAQEYHMRHGNSVHHYQIDERGPVVYAALKDGEWETVYRWENLL